MMDNKKIEWAVVVDSTVPDEPGNDCDGSGVDLAIAALLALPFEKALERCDPLREHIELQEDPADVAAEFQAAWGLHASEILISVLRDILDKDEHVDSLGIQAIFQPLDESPSLRAIRELETAAELAWKNEAVAEEQADMTTWEGTSSRLESLLPETPTHPLTEHIRAVQNFLRTLDHATSELEEWMHGEMAVPQMQNVDDLLQLPFGDALKLCWPLRRFLDNAEDSEALVRELRNNWGLDCSPAMRHALSQIISSDCVMEPRDQNFDDSRIIKSRL
jgi:hypothetical protein